MPIEFQPKLHIDKDIITKPTDYDDDIITSIHMEIMPLGTWNDWTTIVDKVRAGAGSEVREDQAVDVVIGANDPP